MAKKGKGKGGKGKSKGILGAISNFLGSIPVVKKVVKVSKKLWKGIKKLGGKLGKFIKKFRKKLGKLYTKARKKVRKLKKWAIRLGKRTWKTGVLWLKNTVQKGTRWVNQKSKQVYQKAKQVYDKGVNVVKTAAKEAVKAYKSIDTMERLKITEDMSAKEKLLRGVFNTALINTQIKKGQFDATVDVAKDLYGEAKKIAANPIGYLDDSLAATLEGAFNLALHPVQTTTGILDSVVPSFEKDVINGNAYSRSYWITKTRLNIAKELIGRKGTGFLKGIPMPNPIPMRMPMPNYNGILPDSKQPNPSKDPKKPEETKGTGEALLSSNGRFIDSNLESNYANYLARKAKEGKTPRDRLEWKEERDYWLNDSPMARGNKFNKTVRNRDIYDYHEIHLENGKRLDSYDPFSKEIISRKATDLDMIDEKTYREYLKEMNSKYSAGTKIRSNAYPELDGKPLEGKQILEIPATNKNISNIEKYKEIAKEYGIELRFTEE
ncbi:hypothetical protein [Lysinibacillus sp. NPDC056185]|uniref:hypothetical protein n=1 Tax=Lysinibacillus sp. NPDC056185 TaxID=3345739 RepID=UPI0039F096D9